MGAAKVKLTQDEIAAVRKIAEQTNVDIPDGRYDEFFTAMALADTPEL